MKIEINFPSENTLELYIDGEDYSVADIIRHEILKDKHVIFAGLKQIHPLTERFLIKVSTKDLSPLEVVTISGKNAMKNVEDLLITVKKSFEERGG
ncbi:MAG: RpoL/Rpb11 RNA polymerase subunit family protein [Nitrososphaerota archaeon]|nr:RpoL/Rpb11 RNA polymerase subunit family protein [Nitrososphaerota archaeon]